MPKGLLLLSVLLLAWGGAAAQPPDDEYYPYASYEEPARRVESDTALFYRAVQRPADLYGELTAFDRADVAWRRRGVAYASVPTLLDGVAVAARHATALRLLGAEEVRTPGGAAGIDAGAAAGGGRVFRFGAGEPLRPYRAAVRYVGRDYRAGARLSAQREAGRGWRLAAAADLRMGRDGRIEGVFTDAATAALRADKRWRSGRGLALTLLAPLSVRGMRLSSVEEAFRLTGDPYYNPAWGLQGGRVRSSRVRREWMPAAVGRWNMPLGAAASLEVSFGAEAGVRRYSALGWYDARTPMPDNYRYLPSWTGDGANEEAWRRADPRYTQIDWDALIAANRLAGGPARYALEDRVVRRTTAEARAWLTARPSPYLTLGCGVELSCVSERSYKQLRDLLGARYLPDIDHYLVDDDTYGNLLQNDLRRPGRLVDEGGRFGYDYALRRRRAAVRLAVEWRSDRLRAAADAAFGAASIVRRGYYEKELFPGARSFGPSRTLRFVPYALGAEVGWSFSPRSYLALAGRIAAAEPAPEALFFQPLYNNRTVDDPVPERRFGAELRYRRTAPRATIELAAFASASFDAMLTRRYYDDLAGRYCDLAAQGIGRLAWGAEAAVEWRPADRWQVAATAAGGWSGYIRDPRLTILSDSDNTAVDLGAASHLGGCRTGAAPQMMLSARVVHFAPRGWGLRLSAAYAGWRYAEPALVRRTARVALEAGTMPEAFAALVEQERLPDAVTLDAALFKSFYFGRSRLTLSCMADNLLGTTCPYDGYESMRVGRLRSGADEAWRPHATRYSYAAPRSVTLSASYAF